MRGKRAPLAPQNPAPANREQGEGVKVCGVLWLKVTKAHERGVSFGKVKRGDVAPVIHPEKA